MFGMKWFTYLILSVMLCSGISTANCGNDNGNGNGCSGGGTVGPQGPQGPAGQNGTNGTNGTNGRDGTNANTAWHGTDLTADVAVRLLDTKYVQLQAYDMYIFGTNFGNDVFGNGRNQTIGARVVIKLGKSYEEELLEAQGKEIARLKRMLGVK